MFCFLCMFSLWMIQYLFVQKVKCKQSLFVLKISYSFAQIISLATTWQLKKVLENRLTSSASNGSSTWFLFQRLWEATMRPPPAPPSPASWPPPPSASSPSAWGSSRYWLDKFWLERFLWTEFQSLLQAHSLTTEYSTSASQKILYILASLGKHNQRFSADSYSLSEPGLVSESLCRSVSAPDDDW